MEIKFDKAYLEKLYLKEKTSDKKYRFQPQIVTKYRKTIDLLESVAVKLVGNEAGLESVQVNEPYRIEFKTTKEVSEIVITVCNIMEFFRESGCKAQSIPGIPCPEPRHNRQANYKKAISFQPFF